MSEEGNTPQTTESAPQSADTQETDSQLATETAITDPQLATETAITDPQLATETAITDSQLATETAITDPQLATETAITDPQLATETAITDTQLATETAITDPQQANTQDEKVEPSVTAASSTVSSTVTAASSTASSTVTETSTSQSEKPAESNEPSYPNKRAGDELEPEDKSKKAKTEDLTVLKMLCPFWCAGAVIGSKGEHIRQLKEETGCQIRITKNHENFPMTSERVVSVRGEMESIRKVILSVQNKIRNDKPPPTAPSKDNSKRKSCLKLVVSVSSAGRIIGKGGEQTKKLQSLHGVHVDVMKTSDLPPGLKESVITISGDDQDRVDNCMSDVLALVSEDKRANLNYNVDYSSFVQSGPPRGRQMPPAGPDQFRGWGGASQQGWGGAPPAGPPHYFPPPWAGHRQPFNQNPYSRPGNFSRR